MSLFVLWGFGYNTVGLRLGIELEGVVMSRQVIKPEWYQHGTATVYVVLGRDGNYEKYVAGANDGSLPRNLPLGAHIVKERWHLCYLINDKKICDFPMGFYAAFLSAAIVGVAWSAVNLWSYV